MLIRSGTASIQPHENCHFGLISAMSLFMGLPGFLSPFGICFQNIHKNPLRGILSTGFVKYDYTFILFMSEVIFG